jgi:MCP family monocarboxylic acid transporter-like MFS transporter 10
MLALLYLPCISYMSEWFVARRGMANGILFAGMSSVFHFALSSTLSPGTSTGGVLLPLVLPPLITAYGSSKTLRILAIATAILLFPLLLFVKGRLPEIPVRVHGPAPRGAPGPKNWTKQKSFWVFITVNTLQGFAYFVPIVYLPSKPSARSAAATYLIANSICERASYQLLRLGHYGRDAEWCAAPITCQLFSNHSTR